MHESSIVSRGEQQRALWLSTFAFTVCFAVWTIFSIIGIQIKQQLGLNETQFGLLIATPILTGSLIRLLLGIWADQYGGHRVFAAVMLCAAVATWMLGYAHTYPQFLVAALFVGIAGGAFSVGVAYVSKWFPASRQGTALGIFGAGNVGAAVTKLLAPMVMVAAGWIMVSKIWAIALALTAVLFYLFSREDPSLAQRRKSGTKPMSFREQMMPLRNLQVWRFSLYYFFVFGGFVALALWLPHFLTGVYKLDVRTAGILAAFYSIPASLFRIVGGVLSDRIGARRVMYWTFGVSAICTFLLAYPDTQYVVKGIRSDITLHLATGVVPFTVLVFVLGFFMSLGKAAVYKHIPVYYPQHVGSVGGVVGMIGGLGGFVLPIAFGVLNDVVGVWTSCFMLLFVLAAASLAWMHFAIRRMERRHFPQIGRETDLPEVMDAMAVPRDR
ncbi:MULTISPECIES: MFS transporter [Rhodanobacter]|uniref:MFS transporter n=1 Tax=Rhodanobacter TaxID=75309 RepID=UPI00042A5577|nr:MULTISPECIES: nitrate/nitrite transporter [Rhodanobacter]TAN14421.1 MAG: NarK/NasA family nitrate transporter [Rhodanobacter sp.]UJJ54172.1 NarK/NasA family nitrate transporter [Rhodanobacter thiooxydans]